MIDSLFDALLTEGMGNAWLAIALILGVRYLIIAGLAVAVWYGWRGNRNFHRKIQRRWPRPRDYGREIGFSLLTFGIISGIVALVLAGPLKPFTQVYDDVADYGWAYFAGSVIGVLLVHDTYFYWAHRLMHHPRLYRRVHLTHHRSTNPTPWAAFAFHPLEAVAESGIILVVAFLFPVHPGALLVFVLIMTVYNVYGHLGWELYPAGFQRHPVGRWINTSVSHNQHHRHAHSNYGLYFLWWDRWCGTLHPDYDAQFDEVTRRPGAPASLPTA